MRPLNRNEQRLLAVALLIGVLAVAWLGVIEPLVGGFVDRAAQRKADHTTFERNRRLLAAAPIWRAAAEAQRRTAPRFAIAAPSEALAVETLKERLQHLSTDEGFTVDALDDQQADAPPGSVRLRADLTLTLTQLTETLRRLESEDAYVVVDYISITADRALASGRLAPMDVRVELTTAWRRTAAGPST